MRYYITEENFETQQDCCEDIIALNNKEIGETIKKLYELQLAQEYNQRMLDFIMGELNS